MNSRLPTLEKRNGHVESVSEAFETEVEQKPTKAEKSKITIETVELSCPVMQGIDIGEPRRNVTFRLNRRQAIALRHMLLGFEAKKKANGRRVNEQDMMREIFDKVADMLELKQ